MPKDTQIYADLVTLRKGPGLRRLDVVSRVGPALREVFAVRSSLTPAKLVELLCVACDALPADLAFVARAMLAIEPGYEERTLTDRQDHLAATLDVDPVTVRRRSDLALRKLSALLADGGAVQLAVHDPLRRNEWYTASSSVTLRLDTKSPEALQSLTIVALRDGLDDVQLGVGIPRPFDEPRTRMAFDVEVQFGGVLVSAEQLSAEYFEHRVRFPRTLRRGEAHTFGLVGRIPEGQRMAAHHVYRPQRRVDRFELRVRFDRARTPSAVWRVDGIRHPFSHADGPTKDLLEPDAVGEVMVAFQRLCPGLGYGVAWLPRLDG